MIVDFGIFAGMLDQAIALFNGFSPVLVVVGGLLLGAGLVRLLLGLINWHFNGHTRWGLGEYISRIPTFRRRRP